MSTFETARPNAPRPTGVHLARTVPNTAGNPTTVHIPARVVHAGTDKHGIRWWRILGEVLPHDGLQRDPLPPMTGICGFDNNLLDTTPTTREGASA